MPENKAITTLCSAKYILFITPWLLWLLSLFLFLKSPENLHIWAFISAINFIYILRFVRCIPMFVLFLFFFIYSIELRNFFVYDLYISSWKDYQTSYYLNKSSVINGLFLACLGSFSFNLTNNNIVSIRVIQSKNILLFYLSIMLFLVCAHFGMSGDTVLTLSYGTSDREKNASF